MEEEKKSRKERFNELNRRCKELGIWMFLQNHLPENEQMNLEQLKKLTTKELLALYNDLTEQQVKRMATREDAERRTMEALKKKGKWVDEVVKGTSEKEAKNIHETAKAGPNTGAEERKAKPRVTRGSAAPAKPTGKAAKATPAPKPTKGKGKAQKPTGKAKEAAAAPKRKGAPSKNPTYTAIAPNDKAYNPKGFKPQPSSDRMVVLDFIRSKKGQQTRNQIVEHFDGKNVNVDSALYYLGKFGFCRVSE